MPFFYELYGAAFPAMAGLSGRDHMAGTPKSIYSLALYRKKFASAYLKP